MKPESECGVGRKAELLQKPEKFPSEHSHICAFDPPFMRRMCFIAFILAISGMLLLSERIDPPGRECVSSYAIIRWDATVELSGQMDVLAVRFVADYIRIGT